MLFQPHPAGPAQRNGLGNSAVNLIPAFLQRRIAHRPNLVKIVDNIGWLFFGKVLRIIVGVLVVAWIARHLGPEQFGLLNFTIAFIGLFAAIAGLGLQGIVVRDIVRAPETTRLTLGTAAVLQLVGGLVAYLLILGAIAYLRPDDTLARTLAAILGATMLFKASEIAVYWFESQVQSKYTVWVQSSVFLVFAAINVALILKQAPLLAFVWAMLAEVALAALMVIAVMSRLGLNLATLMVTAKRAKTLLKDSWLLILSAIAVSVYMKIDQIMLGQMISEEAVGIYSAAVKISELWYFVPMAIVASVFPAILGAKKRSEELYLARLQRLYDFLSIMSLAVALPMTFLATPLLGLLFGDAYIGAGTALAVHIWASVFVSFGVASGRWLIAEGRQNLALQRTLLGASANVGLNFWLIPLYGATGAAIATVVSFAIAGYLADLTHAETRTMFFMKTRSLNVFAIIKKASH